MISYCQYFALIFISILSLFQYSIQANEATTFKWQVISENPPKGRCLEVDRETMGKVFLKRAPTDRCRPKENQLSTLWMQNPEGPGGRCYIVDAQSMGQLYSSSVGQKECEPQNGSTHLIEGNCYFKGDRSDGLVYLVSVSKERCKPSETILKFQPSFNGLSGKCVSVDGSSGTTFNEPLKKCRPKELEYMSLDVKGEVNCFEVAADGGPGRFIKKVNNKFCRPKEVEYLWIQDEEESGTCYLTSSQNPDYREKTPAKNCFKLYDTALEFRVLSPVRGKCFIVDQKENGGLLRQYVPTNDCMKLAKKLETRLIHFQDRPYCLSIDGNDPLRGFRKTIDLKVCYEHYGQFVWALSDKDPLKGTCYEKVSLGNKSIYKTVQKKKCRTPETNYKWIVKSKEEVLLGKCYEVDKKDGAEGFILKVSNKLCRPKDDLVVRYFHPKKYKKGGCYLVDKKTLGGRYSARTTDRKCKNKLFPKN